jgi:hypothetical protein
VRDFERGFCWNKLESLRVCVCCFECAFAERIVNCIALFIGTISLKLKNVSFLANRLLEVI